jgi:hypothetical protein
MKRLLHKPNTQPSINAAARPAFQRATQGHTAARLPSVVFDMVCDVLHPADMRMGRTAVSFCLCIAADTVLVQQPITTSFSC